jgi:2-polyprenyl-3-methyl-5-hydroxy-6-metoxy-1,4-benzoquinol methylase
MTAMGDVSDRLLEPEVMDDPLLDAGEHTAALRGLERINRVSRSVAAIWCALPEARDEPLSVLDVATGGGDVPIGIWRRAQGAGVTMTIAACDLSPRAIDHARRRALHSGAPIDWFTHDAAHMPFTEQYDVITCSLFLHHLTEDDAISLLRRLAAAARRRVIISDLRRSRMALITANVVCRMLTRSRVVHADGPQSVRAAYTIDEARALADRAGLRGASLRRLWPHRWLLTWDRT